MRITNNMMSNNVLYNIQKSLSRMDKYSNQLSTGKKYVLAEDDPINTVLGMHFRTKITESEQFIRNIDDGIQFLDTCDKALGHSVDLINQIRTSAIYGANDTLDQEDRDAIAREVDQLLNGLIDTANTDFKGDFIFSGAETRDAPFQEVLGSESGESGNVTALDYLDPDKEDRKNLNMNSITRVKYVGDSASLNRQIQQSLDLTVNDTGNNIFSADTHAITSGIMDISDSTVPLNDAANLNGLINSPVAPGNPTTFTIGIEGGYMAAITYNADNDSIQDIADKVNDKGVGVKASVEKEVIDNAPVYRLKFEAEDSGKKIVMFDDDKKSEKTTTTPVFINPDIDGFGAFGFPSTPTGEVIINGKQFVLSDYATVRQFMNDVANDEDVHIDKFEYDSINGTFSIKADKGHFIDIEEKGDINGFGNMGFFSGLGVNLGGAPGGEGSNILDSMHMLNKIESGVTVNSRNALLSTVPNIEEGRVVVNGAIIDIDPAVDTIDKLAKRINDKDVGVRASVEEEINSPGTFRLVLRSLHPGKMNIEDREGEIFSGLGMVSKYDNKYTGYPNEISDPESIGVFQVVMDIRDNLYRGENEILSNENLAKLDEVLDNILKYRSKIGARTVAAETSQSKLDDVRINTTNLLSDVEDVDIAEVIMKMQMAENVQTAALQTGATIIQKTLVDFIR